MAKKPRSDNFDALGSVFDFLFTEARKPPDKRKPIKPSGFSANDALTDAVFSALEKPAAFMSDTVVDEFNSALDYELAVVQIDEYGKLKVTSNNIIDVLKDPRKAVAKSIAKSQGIRKGQRAMFMGARVTDFVTAGWARKYADLESQRAIYGTTVARKLKNQQDKQTEIISRAVGQAASTHSKETTGIFGKDRVAGRFAPHDLDLMGSRSAELLAKKTFSERVWDSMSVDDKREFLRVASAATDTDFAKKEKYGQDLSGVETYLASKYPGSQYIANFRRTLGPDLKADKVGLYNPELYKRLETVNIEDRIRELENLGVRTREQEKQLGIYKKTKYLIARDTAELRNELVGLRRLLRTTTDRETKKQIQKEINEAKSALSVISGNSFLGQIGRLEGHLGSINAVHGANMIPSILNGSFYDKNVNRFFNPATAAEMKVATGGKYIDYEFYTPAKSGGTGAGGKLIDKYNELGTNLYYFTPRSMLRTLIYNGEGFAYLMTRKFNSLDTKAYEGIMGKLAGGGIDKGTIWKILSGNDGQNLENELNSFLTSAGSLLTNDELNKLSAVLKSAERYKKLTSRFSMPFKIQTRINDFFAAKLKRVRVSIARKLMANPKVRDLFVRTGGSRLLGSWIASGSLKTLMQSLVTTVAGALGIVGTPLVSFVVSAVAWVATDFAMKILAELIVIGKYMLLGLVGLIVLILFWGSGAVKSFNKTNYSYYNETPGSIIQCSVYEEVELEEDEDPWGDVIIPPPSGESCILGSGSFWCSQGYKDVEGWSHQRIPHLMPVDLTNVGYIYAPQFCSSGNCSITRIARINCSDGSNAGGIVELTATNGFTTYLFKFLHVKPLAGLGEKLSGGQPVAVVQDSPEVERGYCWTGKHLHLETRQNGSVVDPLELLQSFSCGVPDESSCANP